MKNFKAGQVVYYMNSEGLVITDTIRLVVTKESVQFISVAYKLESGTRVPTQKLFGSYFEAENG